MVQCGAMNSAWMEGLLAGCLLFGGATVIESCSFPQPAPVIVHEGAYDIVALEPLSGRTPAQHPAFIDQTVMETILKGIYVQDDERLLQRLLTGRTPPSAVFPDDQRASVSRALVTALARATSQQQIAFSVSNPRNPVEEIKGVLSCAEPFLYFTLQHIRGAQPSLDRAGRPLPDRTGLASRRLLFQLPAYTDSAAQHPSPATLVIDYMRLQQWLASHGAGAATVDRLHPTPSTAAADIGPEGKDRAPAMPHTSLHELIVRKDLEIESLKEEIRTLQRALEVQRRQVDRLKGLPDATHQP
jgi:hypothetical protein